MKASKYNVIFECGKKKYIFNTLSCALAEIDSEVASKLSEAKALDCKGQENILKQMQNSGFILNDDIDELLLLKYRHYKGKSSTIYNSFNITIAPTLLCNFECPYCYESTNKKFIKNEVKEAIYKKIETLSKQGRKVIVTWFGGEPLIAKDIVKEMSEKINQICKKYGMDCKYSMISNGYLLDRSTISELLNLGINYTQVTIDGIPEIHNMRRKLKGTNPADTFNKIIENMKTGIKMGMEFKIRINIDKSNYFCLDELLKTLAKEGFQDCSISLGHVRGYTKSEISNNFTSAEYGKLFIKFANLLKKYDFKNYKGLCYPFGLFSFCSAGIENYLIIDPDGYLYKCIVEIGDVKNSYGNILTYSSGYSESVNNLKYLMKSPFDCEECVNCKVLPLCMGGCAYYALKNGNELDCPHWKYDLEDKLCEICKIIH